MTDRHPGPRFADSGHDRFTDWLRARAEPAWTRVVDHRFVDELAADTLADGGFRRYLVQDYAFVEALASTVGHAVGRAPSMAAKAELAGFLATLTSDEDEYFRRAFDALDVPAPDRTVPDRTPTTEAFDDLLRRAALEGGYPEVLAVLLPVEWSYLTWATARADAAPDRFYLAEWIDLHADPGFAEFVGWLRRELDDHGPALPAGRQRLVDRHFRRAVALEVAFFDAAYGASAAD